VYKEVLKNMKLSYSQQRQTIWERLKTFGFPHASVEANRDGIFITCEMTRPKDCSCSEGKPVCEQCLKEQNDTKKKIDEIVRKSPAWVGGQLIIDVHFK